jgi:mRNA interferase MazF
MKCGDMVIVSAPGYNGKPRPAVVIQSDKLQCIDSILVSLITSTLVEAPLFRLSLEPSEKNGLKQKSQVMIDKIVAIPRAKCTPVIGHLERQKLITLNHMLAVVIGIAD